MKNLIAELKMLLKNINNFLNNRYKGTFHNIYYFLKNFSSLEIKNLKQKIDTKSDIWIFDSSSKLTRYSLYSAFSFLITSELDKKKFNYAILMCASGPGFCQVGASPKNPNNPMPCNSCIETNLNLYKNSKKIFFTKKDNYKKIKSNNETIRELVQPSKKWLARGNKNSKTVNLIEENLSSAGEKWIEFLEEINTNDLPKVAIIFNGYSFPESIIKHYLDDKGVKTFTFEMGFKEDSIFTSTNFAPDYFFDFDHKVLTNNEKEKLSNYMVRRSKGDFSRGSISFWNKMDDINPSLLEKVNKHSKVITIFLNVPFDTSQALASELFNDTYDWIDFLSVYIKENNDYLFIFRSHPDEIREDKKTNFALSEYIKEKKLHTLSNVLIIRADETTDSYALIKISDLVLTYNSTITIESLYFGTNAINAGHAHFSRIDYFKLAENKEKYLEKVEEFLKSNTINEKIMQDISSYLYQLIFNSSIDLSSQVESLKKYEYHILDNPPENKEIQNFVEKLINNVESKN